MKNKISSYLKKLHGSNKVRGGIVLTLALALLVYNCGSDVQRLFGATAADGPICDLEEHTHTEECYATVLICDHEEGPDGSAPIHDAATCYESVFVCNMAEHVHGEECYVEIEEEVGDSDADTDSSDQGSADEGTSSDKGSNDADTAGSGSLGGSSYDDANPSGSDSSEVEGSTGDENFIEGSVSDSDEKQDDIQTMLMADGSDIMLFNSAETGILQIGITSAVNASAAYVNTADGLVDMHTATKMLSGDWQNNNSQDNPYNLYVGETLLIDATQESNGQTLEIKKYDDSDYTVTVGSGWQSNGLTATYQGTTPGEYKIVLKSESDTVLSAFYFEVKYPIFVETKRGDVHKDRVHEYLDIVHNDAFKQNPKMFVLDKNGTPSYVKNGDNPGKYMMYSGYSVVLSAYTWGDDPTTFEIINPDANRDVKITTDNKKIPNSNFNRVEAKVELGDSCKIRDVKIQFGEEIFWLYARDADKEARGDDANHFDIEIVDGGIYTDVCTALLSDGTIQTTTTVYTASITGIDSCRVYDDVNKIGDDVIKGSDGKLVGLLTSEDYGWHGGEGGTQYELTSAYKTEQDGKGGWNAKIGEVAERDIRFVDVKKVVFNINLLLVPQKQTIVIKKADGTIVKSYEDKTLGDDPDDVNISYDNYSIEMKDTAILDALNKCPQHNGLDFTLRIDLNTVSVQPTAFKTVKAVNGGTVSKDRFEFGLYRDEKCENLLEQVKSDKNGNVFWSLFRFTQSELEQKNEYAYYVKEIPNNISGITYDTHVYEMEIIFQKDVDEGWKPDVTYTRLNPEEEEEEAWNGVIPEFINTYNRDTNGTNTPTNSNGTGNGGGTNKKTVDVDVRIDWEDDGKNRPDEVVVELVDENGVVQDTVTLSESNNWSYTWKERPNQKWTVREKNRPDGFTYRENHNGFHFVFIHNEKLLQTGQLSWPIPFLAGFGLVFIGLGLAMTGFGRKKLNGR